MKIYKIYKNKWMINTTIISIDVVSRRKGNNSFVKQKIINPIYEFEKKDINKVCEQSGRYLLPWSKYVQARVSH